MCGICGVVTTGAPPELTLLDKMMSRLGHRGPDGHGFYRDHRAALGHTRLAIIDTAGGAQPLCNEDGTLWVTFNGEIFNYVELARELKALGHRFRTASDTEVIVHAWEQWGAGSFDRFNGQWALALWDSREQRLILCRDRMGVRPLFYTRTRDRFLFASEVKALFADPAVPRSFDPEGLSQTFGYWSTVAPRTVFSGVEQLPPGHHAVLDRTGFRVAPYWRASFPPRGSEPCQDTEENAAQLRERVIEATRLRFLRSDVPVGAYLSGGLDSSITAAVISRYTDADLHTFSLRFQDREFDEGGYQRQMSNALGTRHQDIVVRPSDIVDVFPQVIRHTETPLVRAAPAPMYLLSKLVAEHGFKVVVTGEGADEVLAGYDVFREARVRMFWARDPESAKRAKALELLYPWMERSPGKAPAFARSFFGRNLDLDDPALSHRPRWDSTASIKTMFSADMRNRTTAGALDDVVAGMPAESAQWDPLSRAQWLEMTTLLPGYLLSSQGDRMLMANSVEGRFPFLDRNVIEFANQLPARHKLFGLDEKYLLKRAFADIVPQDISRRPKQPYRAPDAASFFASDRPEWFDELTSEPAISAAGVFDPRLVSGLFRKCAKSGGDGMSNTDNMRVLAVVSTQLTYECFIAGTEWSLPERKLPQPTVAVDLVTTKGECSDARG
ncbi:asparagine synthase (glutamine-hydrolyzing) [Mycolicibacterium arabiense]|uniref:asparagine synthase (glutamine-hydrolyzing) n=1 Tax=Mycolicibacterium arabiense TaxID=1286181 RepID=A0A7I7S4Y8_9MYCO|nr:asparagine synthase (glutamine-hydrolyzing) [Mycolicibacterium arabiense]MCV7372218.1 asparagine synthase (glutamine-hydrolyzing) [Mycolicibacterium arabiense]BBY51339.1 asparagine synthase (glutamine-hydrolyzing) [Mycolicibacterium arabiense]